MGRLGLGRLVAVAVVLAVLLGACAPSRVGGDQPATIESSPARPAGDGDAGTAVSSPTDGGSLQARVTSVDAGDGGLVVTLALDNQSNRSLYYISGVRALNYEPEVQLLTVRLSDMGRAPVPGLASVLPEVEGIEPGDTAVLTLRLPEEITQLRPSPDGDRTKVAFDKYRVVDASEVTVEVAWADAPFDPTQANGADDVLPGVRWQQHLAVTSIRR